MQQGDSIDPLEGLEELGRRLAAVRSRIDDACARAGRDPADVRLIAVTKTLSPAVVETAVGAGITEFGENYVAELEQKHAAAPEATWHLIGRVQSNKARRVAELADVVHTLEPGRASERLGRLGRERGTPVRALVEVDFTGRRVGVAPEEAPVFVDRVVADGGIELTGLMTVAPHPSPESPRTWFAGLRRLRDEIAERHPEIRELSMGMSADLDDAIGEGATMVRVGSAIFGPRR